MRQYRAIPIDGKDFVYGWYFELDGMSFIENQAEKSNNRCTIEVIPETVGQQTGLKDKNKEEIYHHDIVKWTHQTDADKHFTKMVEWSNERAGWILSGHPMNRIDLFSPETNLEIIGNVHQPEPVEKL